MFSADFSFHDPHAEKVGERKERLARERKVSSAAASIASGKSSQSSHADIASGKSSKSSHADDRELWWTSSLKKAKSTAKAPSSIKRSRPSTSRLPGHVRKLSNSISQTFDIHPPSDYKDPILQPAWTYSTSLASTLPSGAPLDPPEYEVPELEGDMSSRCTNSSESRSSSECELTSWGAHANKFPDERPQGWKCPGKIQIIDEVHELQQLSPRSFVARTTSRHSELVDEPEELPEPRAIPMENAKVRRGLYSVKIEGCLRTPPTVGRRAPLS